MNNLQTILDEVTSETWLRTWRPRYRHLTDVADRVVEEGLILVAPPDYPVTEALMDAVGRVQGRDLHLLWVSFGGYTSASRQVRERANINDELSMFLDINFLWSAVPMMKEFLCQAPYGLLVLDGLTFAHDPFDHVKGFVSELLSVARKHDSKVVGTVSGLMGYKDADSLDPKQWIKL